MGKLLAFPGVSLDPPARGELVDEASKIMMKEVLQVFVEQEYEIGSQAAWHQAIRDFFWRLEIRLDDSDFRECDLRRWRSHWRGEALDFIRAKRPR